MGNLSDTKILYIEDSETQRQLVKSVIEEQCGFHVDTVATGAEGLKSWAVGSYDVLAVDYELPDMNGINICHAILTEQPELPIVMVTGKGDESIAAEALNIGVSHYITKSSPTIFMSLLPVIIRKLADQAVELRERKRAELALKKSEENAQRERELLIGAISSFKDGFAFYDKEDKLVICNETYLAAMNGKVDELLPGMSYEEVLRIRAKHNPSTASEEWIQDRIRHHTNPTQPFESTQADGRVFQLHDFKTQDGGTATIRIDVTDLKKAEEDLHAAEEHSQLILDSVGEGIYGVDSDGSFTFVNPTALEMLGFTDKELIGNNSHELIHHTHPDGSSHPNEKCPMLLARLDGKDYTDSNDVFWRKDGTSFPVEYTSKPIMKEGELVGNVVAFRDITERKEIDRMKSEFISTVSHELRTPLTSIKGSLGLLIGGAVGAMPEKAGGMLDLAARNTDRLINLVNDILDMEKLESGDLEFDFQTLDLSKLVAEAVETNKGFADEHDAIFILSETPPDVMVEGDGSRLSQVIANLLSNAAKFSPGGGEVEISIAQQNSVARVSISDHGPGIPEGFGDQLFERFTQVDSSATRQKGGTGLGLNISKSIVERHGGTIDYISEVDFGSTFFFTLPVSK
ncbi:MAG: response regulator [Rhodospirillaceae bacterium]|jgi:PAS domain S-box-containing protein|nr:response regulator [Rhodospirillaceae bacterium]MBT5036318.1 response regulator [Rhodospirillaceae bacterium]